MRRVFLSSLIALFGFVAQSHAEITFGFAASEVAEGLTWTPPATPSGGSARFVVSPDESLRISIFLLERGGDTRLSQEGVFQIGLEGTFDPSAGQIQSISGENLPTTNLPLDPTNGFAPVFQFVEQGPPSFDNAAGKLNLIGGIPLLTLQDGNSPGKGVGSTFLGYFDFKLNGASTAQFTFTDPNPSPTIDNNLLALKTGPGENDPFVNLDPELFPGGGPSASVLTITAIPEPSSVMLLSGACGIVLLRRRRR